MTLSKMTGHKEQNEGDKSWSDQELLPTCDQEHKKINK